MKNNYAFIIPLYFGKNLQVRIHIKKAGRIKHGPLTNIKQWKFY